jgi:hypothetical protein
VPRSRRLLVTAVLAASALLYTGCIGTTTATPSPTPTPTVTPSPTPTPTPTPEPVLSPTVAFDGDCAQLLSERDLDGFLGEGWKTRTDIEEEWDIDPTHPERVFDPLRTVGGVECWWYPAEEEDGLQQIAVMVAPADSVPASFTEKFSEARCEGNYDGSACYLVRTEGDAWLMATVGNLIDEPPVSLLEGMLDVAATGLKQPLDAEAVSRDGWWTIPTCEDFGAAMRLEEMIGENYNTGFWEGSESPELIMLREGGVAVRCEWSTSSDALAPDGGYYVPSVHVANGAHWQWSELATLDDAEELSVAGAQDAVVITDPDRDSFFTLFATDGVNVIKTQGADLEFLVELAERALAALR